MPVATPVATPAKPVAAPVGAPATPADPSGSIGTSLPVGAMPARVTRQSEDSLLLAAVPFVHMQSGLPLANGQVHCRAEVDGRRLRVLANVYKGEAARCAWRIPTWAKGKQLTGVVAVQIGTAAAKRLFMRTLG